MGTGTNLHQFLCPGQEILYEMSILDNSVWYSKWPPVFNYSIMYMHEINITCQIIFKCITDNKLIISLCLIWYVSIHKHGTVTNDRMISVHYPPLY